MAGGGIFWFRLQVVFLEPFEFEGHDLACHPALPSQRGSRSQHKAVAAVVAVSAWRFSEKVHVQLFLQHVSKFYLKSIRKKS